jgi:YD repeat-containing protein
MTSELVSSATTAFAWDYENRLTSATLPVTGGTVTFKYDPFGKRIYESSSSDTTSGTFFHNSLLTKSGY